MDGKDQQNSKNLNDDQLSKCCNLSGFKEEK